MADTTIMMVTFNRLELTKDTFKLALDKAGKKFNFVVVDNGSEDGTVEWLKDVSSNFMENKTIVALPKNRGIAIGRNVALKACRELYPETEYFCTLDNDIGIYDNWLTDCCDVVEYVPRIGSCGVNLEGNEYPKSSVNLNGRKLTIRIKPRGNLGGVCTVTKKHIFDKLGYFITDMDWYGHEDSDIHMRLRRLGYGVAYLDKPGIDLCAIYKGVDEGEYREFKNEWFKKNLPQFNKNAALYARGQKSLFIDFKEDISEYICKK